ncbi:MAG: metabolite traffic protein EboE [Thermomicrobiales bacterium]|nr:metabolite traffic protein EboE [Thermomicrobiales bacterium]
MRLGSDGFFDLTYCTNIHPSTGWEDVLANVRRYALPLKARFAPDAPFAVGLRLSGAESRELLEDDRLASFKEFLDEHGLYVATMNAFPYGPFHNQVVKEHVHSPDWRDEERVAYTLRMVEILSALLPAGMEGGISTSPLSYKTWVDPNDEATWDLFIDHLLLVAAALSRLRDERGQVIHLDIEPEPDGVLGTCGELADFYERRLLPQGAPKLAAVLGIDVAEARARLLEHLRVCFDACHVAVGYEDPAAVLDRFAALGIGVGKVQVSSALKVDLSDETIDPAAREATARTLATFADAVYLHQVLQRDGDGDIVGFPDLPDALPSIDAVQAAEWRVHFHVPVFVDRYATFASTQDELRRVLALTRERRMTPQLEIETYTWDVLPPELKVNLLESIEREYAWALDVF